MFGVDYTRCGCAILGGREDWRWIVQKGQGQIQERREEGMGVRFGEQHGGRACWEPFLVVVIFSLLGPSSAKNGGKS